MSLMHLPNELLDQIVECTLSHRFGSLALTCKRLYARCATFIKRHNELRSRFRDFKYCVERYGDSVVTASDLITLIATEPFIARYIRTADLSYDSILLRYAFVRGEPFRSVPSIDDGGAVIELFANSNYLRKAGLNWKEYYAIFEQDVREQRYSQHGSAFLLTLLPDVEKLIVPRSWKPNIATKKLLDAIIVKAKQQSPLSPVASLISVTRFEGGRSSFENRGSDLSWMSPFLALPHMRSFCGPSCFASGDDPGSLAFRCSRHIAETLQAAHLTGCCIDDVGIADFLADTPHLKTLRYWHGTKNNSSVPDWDICKFVNAVARVAGSRLVEFSVTIQELRGSIVPGKASMSGFQKLKKLQYPLDLVVCNMNATGAANYITNSLQRFFNSSMDPFVYDLIPPSVTRLSLTSGEADSNKKFLDAFHEKALYALFHRFRTLHKSQLSALQEIQIPCSNSADKAYKQQCNKISAEASDEGVVVRLRMFESDYRFHWDGEI